MNKRIAALVALSLAMPVLAQGQDATQPVKAGEQEKAPAKQESKLVLGDKAPKLQVESFVKGKEIKELKPGNIYVVEFWATWCGPCKVSIPHLSEMQKKVGDKATVIGVAIWQEEGALNEVKQFVTDMGQKMDYTVAYGGFKGPMEDAWMKASGAQGIPTAFIVDKQGRVAWMGHPMDGMDKALDEVIAGTYDISKAVEKARKKAELEVKAKPINDKLSRAARAGKWEDAVKAADELYALDNESFSGVAVFKFKTLLTRLNKPDEAYAFIGPVADAQFKDNAQALNDISWTILDTKGVEKRDFDLAIRLAKRAAELTKEKDGMILDTLAFAYYQKGDKAKAIEIQTKAVDLAPDGEMKKEMQERLDQFKAGK